MSIIEQKNEMGEYSQKPALFSPRLDSKQEEIKNEEMPG